MKKLLPLSCIVFAILGACQQTKPEVFEVASINTNRQCPMIIDEVTTLDSTRYHKPDNTFIYYYTLTGTADNPDSSANMSRYLQQNIPRLIKSSQEMEIYRKADVTIMYVYYSEKTKTEQLCLTITPEMYN